MQQRHVRVREYAAAYGVSTATVYGMVAAGKLPHVRLGTGRGTIRIPIDAAEREGDDAAVRQKEPAPPLREPRPRLPPLSHVKVQARKPRPGVGTDKCG